MDEGDKTDLKGTQEPSSNSSAKEGSDDEGGLGDTYFSHSKKYHHEPSNLDTCQGHSTLSSQSCFEGARLTQLIQLVTASRLFLGHEG